MRGRQVIPAQDPNLHLVWYRDRIFIKPIPIYLTSQAVWEYMAHHDPDLWRACAGFMRTYAHLIRYEIDFDRAISTALGLIPSDPDATYEKFAAFIAPFAALSDGDVGDRFAFGELRLNRLNLLARAALFRRTFFHVESHSGALVMKILAPLITLCVFVTTVLNGMQVEVSVQSLGGDAAGGLGSASDDRFTQFAVFSKWFSIAVIGFVFFTFLFMLGLMLTLFACDYCFSRAVKKRKEKDCQEAAKMKSGIV